MSHILNSLKKAQTENTEKLNSITTSIQKISIEKPAELVSFLETKNGELLSYSVYAEILNKLITGHEQILQKDGEQEADDYLIKYLSKPTKQILGNLSLNSTNQTKNLINEIKFNIYLQLQEQAQQKFMLYQINL